MNNLRIVIVDDSPFSIAIIKDILEEKGFEVVGEASSLDEVKSVVSEVKPNLVTMDMTMPGTDGFECTRAIHEIDPKIKVVIVSSMMDEEIVRKAKMNKVSGYVQKPVDSEELTLVINRIMADNDLFCELEKLYPDTFKESLSGMLNRMAKIIPEFKNEKKSNEEIISSGVSIVMGIIGKYSGRMILNFSKETAENMALKLLKKDKLKDNNEMIAVMNEFSNITSGNACSILNRKNKLFGFRVAPPTAFYGEMVNISKSALEDTFSVIADTEFGPIYMNVGFKRSDEQWT